VTVQQPYKTARCILYRQDRFLLAVHGGFWGVQQQRWGLPGGQIERGEAPAVAAARELEEELNVYVQDLIEVGAYPYKRALHMVYAAPVSEPIRDWDESELIDVRWFTEADVAALKAQGELHANYELEAIRSLLEKLAA
jgi:8-oxo-dGTP pyrophosphatase MutT (NUDIX family)